MVHNDLVKWLKLQLDDKDFKWLFIDHETSQNYMAMVYECREASLIAFDGYIPLQHAVRYGLTPQGEIALGIDSTGAGSDVARERLEHYLSHSLDVKKRDLFRDLQDIDSDLLTNILIDLQRENKVVFDTSGMDIVYHWNTPAPQPEDTATETGEYTLRGYRLYAPNGGFMCSVDDTDIVDILNGETASLREQNARLQRELEAARERIAELGTQVNTAIGEATQRGNALRAIKERLSEIHSDAKDLRGFIEGNDADDDNLANQLVRKIGLALNTHS